MESNNNEFKKSKFEILLKPSSSRESLDFTGLDSYIKQGEENMAIDQKGFISRVSVISRDKTSNMISIASEASYFKKEVSINKVPLKDKLVLSDFEKYYKFGIFPYIVFIHIMIVFITTTIVNEFLTFNISILENIFYLIFTYENTF